MNRRPSRIVLLLLVGLLFGTAAGAASVFDPAVLRVPEAEVQVGPGEDVAPADRDRPTEPDELDGELGEPPPTDVAGADLGWLAGLGLLILLAVGLAVMWRTMRDRVTLRPTGAGPASLAERRDQVRAAVAAGLDELAADGQDPRSAVIGCWLRLERAAAEAGTRREAADTPGDLVARMLAEHAVSAQVLDRLAAVYRHARYAPHEVAESMRDEARAALRQLDAELSSGAAAVGAVPGRPAGEVPTTG